MSASPTPVPETTVDESLVQIPKPKRVFSEEQKILNAQRAAAGKAKYLANRKHQIKPKDLLPKLTGDFALPDPKPEYYEEDGLRKVKPYTYAFHSWAKERWQNRTLIDVYGEFRDRSPDYYKWSMEQGLILLNNEKTSPNAIIQNGDLISNLVHRHEPAVLAGPVKILYDGRLPGNDGQTLVVEKPGSMPVHSTGRFHFNCLLAILKYDYNLPLVHTSNRLDRLTSGVMICALTTQKSKELGAWFGGRKGSPVYKEYVARVAGEFPQGEIKCEEPLLTVDRQLGVNIVHPLGRPSETHFTRLSYDPDSNTSVVKCRPITGRSHQIRVHLQFLGYPIGNDPLYNNLNAWGSSGGRGGVYKHDQDPAKELENSRKFMSLEERQKRWQAGEKVIERFKEFDLGSKSGESPSGLFSDEPVDKRVKGDTSEAKRLEQSLADRLARDQYEEAVGSASRQGEEAPELNDAEIEEIMNDQTRQAVAELRRVRDEADGWARVRDMDAINKKDECEEEHSKQEGANDDSQYCPKCFQPLIPDPKPEELYIWLHALRYKTTDWDFQSELPTWAGEKL